jgi:ABC-type transport system substrate-binding protein
MRAPDSRAERVHLIRNPHHRRSLQAAFDDIVFEVYPRSKMADLAADLEAGRVHCTMALSAAHARDLRNVQTTIRPGDSTGILYLNTERPALANRTVRRGLVAAIDRYKLTRIAYPEMAGFTAKGPVPPSLGRSLDGQRPDRAAAAQMVAGLKTSEDAPLQMLVVWADRPYLPEPTAVAEELVRQFAAVGVHVRAVPARDADDFGHRVRAGDYDLVLGGWIAESDDPGDFLESLVYSGAVPREGASSGAANFSRWRDEPVDDLVDQFRNGGSGQLLEQIVDRIAGEAPFLALMHGAVVATYSERLRNFSPSGGYVPALSSVELRPSAP